MQNRHLNGAGHAVEQVWHEDLVLLVLVAVGEDVCALDGLVKVSEDIIDDDNGLGSISWAGDICCKEHAVSRGHGMSLASSRLGDAAYTS